MILKKYSYIIWLLFSTLWLISCKELPSQNPKDSFASGRYPKQLEWLRSQLRELSLKDKENIIKRSQDDSHRSDLLRIAVVDGGIDLAHPDLINQIEYRVVDGQIIGAGYDLMGDNTFASHIYVDPTIFAFAAESMKGRLIDQYNPEPLQLLKKINDRFAELITNGIASNEALRTSLFSKLNKQSISILGFEELRRSENIDKLLSKYHNTKLLFNQQSTEALAQDPKQSDLYKTLTTGWSISPTQHSPQVFSQLSQIEHADLFLNLVNQSFAQINSEYNYSHRIENMNIFLGLTAANAKTTVAQAAQEALRRSLGFILWGYKAFDPLANLEKMFQTTPQYQGKSWEQALTQYFQETQQRVEAQLTNPDLDKDSKQILKQGLKQLNDIIPIAKSLEAIKNNPEQYKKLQSDLRRFFYRTEHPYLSSESGKNHHGTHVAGIIAKQDPRIRILPIRLTTSSTPMSDERKNELLAKFNDHFYEWTKQPIIVELIKNINKEYGNIRFSDSKLKNGLADFMQENANALVFVDEMLRTIDIVGKEKVKIASISLGLLFKKEYSLDNKFQGLISDLFTEYIRFQLGKAMYEKAPGTLFVIASGNDGAWVDGVSRSMFPAGITSVRLLQIANQKGFEHTPNNKVRNVLVVNSINPNGTLTAFTNLFIDPRIKQLYSTGEEIMSPVPAKDPSRTNEIVNKRFESSSSMFEKLKTLESAEQASMQGPVFQETLGALTNYLQATYPISRIHLSGTSMATPTISGLSALEFLKLMKEKHVTTSQSYESSELAPEKIILNLEMKSKPSMYSLTLPIAILSENINNWGKSHTEISTQKALKTMIKSQQINACVRIY